MSFFEKVEKEKKEGKTAKKEVKAVKPKKVKKEKSLKTTRKVYFVSGRGNKDIPKILLEGSFLEGFGFKVGDTYTLKGEDGILTLTKNGKTN